MHLSTDIGTESKNTTNGSSSCEDLSDNDYLKILWTSAAELPGYWLASHVHALPIYTVPYTTMQGSSIRGVLSPHQGVLFEKLIKTGGRGGSPPLPIEPWYCIVYCDCVLLFLPIVVSPGLLITVVIIELIGRKLTMAAEFVATAAGFLLLFICANL